MTNERIPEGYNSKDILERESTRVRRRYKSRADRKSPKTLSYEGEASFVSTLSDVFFFNKDEKTLKNYADTLEICAVSRVSDDLSGHLRRLVGQARGDSDLIAKLGEAAKERAILEGLNERTKNENYLKYDGRFKGPNGVRKQIEYWNGEALRDKS